MKKIFIVEDDVMLTEALRDFLSQTNAYEIHTFSTGEECLPHLHEDPDIFILDYYLNTVNEKAANGIAILEQIKKVRPHATVIMLSSQESYGTALQTIVKGAEHYIIKDEDAFQKIQDILDAIR